MTEKQLFSVLVRALGVLVVLVGIRCVAQDLNAYLWPPVAAPIDWLKEWLYCGGNLVLGLALIRWPDWIVRFAWHKFPSEQPDDEQSSN